MIIPDPMVWSCYRHHPTHLLSCNGRKMMKRVLIVQPWFSGFGHPAQSLINLASAIGCDERVQYLVSVNDKVTHYVELMHRLEKCGQVYSFNTGDISGTSKWNTLRALLKMGCMRLRGLYYDRIFFFDVHLKFLAIFWPLLGWIIRTERVSLIYLNGPEHAMNLAVSRWIVSSFLRRPDVVLYLRTEELATDWKGALGEACSEKVRYLPSLEIPDDAANVVRLSHQSSELKFGILGQIRPGKGIDKLVPIFLEMPSIGWLTVAGAFYNEECRNRLSVLESFSGFINRFLDEGELLQLAADQDYLLMLYDDGWDPRLESAVLYLAARVKRPVIVYDRGWSSRKVREFGCGLLASTNHEEIVELLKSVPRPGSDEYSKLIEGVERFKNAHSVTALRSKVLSELVG